ncbi:hypothetical protein DEI91_03535 [Curtobacterium sp. MCBD17_032]|nr:hypothetical protein DEI91_03535 [Curtobacterium sp. MCBD17_032]
MRDHPRAVATALGVGAGLPATAGAVLAGLPVPLFTCVTLVAVVAAWRRPAVRPVPAALWVLVAFAAWSTVMTVVGPWAFHGTPVLLPRGGVDEQVRAPSPLTYTTSNLAQTVYLLTALVASTFLARTGTATTALRTAAWTGAGGSAVRSTFEAVGIDPLAPVLDTLAVDYSPAGDTRWRGVFAEPSELAAFSMGVSAFAIVTAARTRGTERVAAVALSGVGLCDLLASASGTAVAASAIVGLAAVVVVVARFLASGGRGAPAIALGTLVVVGVAVAAGDRLLGPVRSLVVDKVGSQSFDARSAADAIGLRVAVDSLGFGVGLGSDRSSSFVVTLLATTGVVGLGLFASAVTVLLRSALRAGCGDTPCVPPARSPWSRPPTPGPVVAGLLALLAAKAVSTPDLSTPLLWLLIAGCLGVGRPHGAEHGIRHTDSVTPERPIGTVSG